MTPEKRELCKAVEAWTRYAVKHPGETETVLWAQWQGDLDFFRAYFAEHRHKAATALKMGRKPSKSAFVVYVWMHRLEIKKMRKN